MLHPHALRLITQNRHRIDAALRRNPEANRLFLAILAGRKDPAPILRRMSEAQVLGKFVPDFGRVVAQMQFDMYHLYTVDEHTLQCLSVLHEIETGALKAVAPIVTEIVHELLRSEEHTSELQSLMRISYAVFCLKTKKRKTT